MAASNTLTERKTAQKVTHLSAADRAAQGKAARAEVPLEAHGDWVPAADRPSPLALLEEQATSRVPELVPIRHGRMAASPFAFFRGAAYVFAADMGPLPRSRLTAQLCGDAHLSNFGGFASPERSLVFDVNDFDETHPGPFEWDIKRLAASLEIAARSNGFKASQRAAIVRQATSCYRRTIRGFAGMRNLDVWYSRLDMQEIVRLWGAEAGPKAVRTFEDNTLKKAQSKDRMKALAKLTRRVDGQLQIVSDPPLIVRIEELSSDVDASLMLELFKSVYRSYRRTLQGDRRRLLETYRVVDVARKVVGVGSVGTRAWVALLVGRDEDDPLFLQLKEAQASVLEPFTAKSVYSSPGQRVVEGQHLMQTASDIFLGWERSTGLDGHPRNFYVRQLWDWKMSVAIETLAPPILGIYGQMCAWTLARAHARSGDGIAIASYLGNSERFDEAIVGFARAYADQNERDHKDLIAAIADGRIAAQAGI
jgi:uncharacterized protein (DUF2252 family)